ncbi:hypothetical protein E4T56_gene6280 [Termitomyces sp. T112]|nr:hypothetical protein E4T56_gene6280 [Termitomyces sp. T112]
MSDLPTPPPPQEGPAPQKPYLPSDNSRQEPTSWLEAKGWAQAGEPYNCLKLVQVLMTAAAITKGSHLENDMKNAILAVAFLLEDDITDQKADVITEAVATKVLDWVNNIVNHLTSSTEFASATGTSQAEKTLALKEISGQLQSVSSLLNNAAPPRPTWANIAAAHTPGHTLQIPTQFNLDLLMQHTCLQQHLICDSKMVLIEVNTKNLTFLQDCSPNSTFKTCKRLNMHLAKVNKALNIHKSAVAQAAVINLASPSDWDVLALQELYLDKLGNTRASRHWIGWRNPMDYSNTRVLELKITSSEDLPHAMSNEAKALVLAKLFFPPPSSITKVPITVYPKPLPGIQFFTHKQIWEAVALLHPYKAPSPDGILSVVLKQCINVLRDHLYFIFRAVLELDVYHRNWLVSTTLVLCKPGKPLYKEAKAYQPIGLLNTTGKLLSILVAADLSFLAEKHRMLPPR